MRFALAALLAGLLIDATALLARAQGVYLHNVSVGIDGNYQVGRWTAIEADVESDAWPVTLVVRVPDPDGNLTLQPSVEVQEPDGKTAHIRSLFKTGRLTDNDDTGKSLPFDGFLNIDVVTPDGTSSFHLTAAEPTSTDQVQVESLKDAWTQKTRFWATLGESEGYQQAVDRIIDRGQGARLGVHLIRLSDADALPTQPDALESLSTLAVTGRQTFSEPTNEAVRQWVADGGHLIVSVATPDDYAAMPISEWIPIEVTGLSRLRDLATLTTQLPGSAPIRVNVVDALQFNYPFGETVAATLDGPLWAKVPYGYGHITILGVDLSQRPLVNWESLPQLCESLSEFRRPSASRTQRTATTQLSQTGVSELQTQLVMGLDQFPASRKPSTWFAMGLILLYLLAIGPLDYLIVHKILRRPHWTWFTFPLMVLAAAGAAAATARDRNPQSMLANQVDLVDIDATTSTARVNSWVAFTSPQLDRYHIDAQLTGETITTHASDGDRSRLSWPGIAETGFRGMYRAGGIDQWKAAYRFAADDTAIMDLPLGVWSSANITNMWSDRATPLDQVVRHDLRDVSGTLFGTLTNQLSEPMLDWCLAHEGRVYLPMSRNTGAAALRIAPGETIDLSDGSRVVPHVLQSFLTGVRRIQRDFGKSTGKETVASRDTYDPLDRDPFGVLRMATFFKAARGEEFTALDNDTLERLDLSDLLPLDRAILFCRVASPAARFSINDQPLEPTEHDTILRIVLPVKSRRSDSL